MTTNTQLRAMRALQRSVVKLRNELSESHQEMNLFQKRVSKTAGAFLNHLQSVKNERDLLRKSLKNFNDKCCKQLHHIQKQDQEIKALQKACCPTAVKHSLHAITRTTDGRRTTSI
jgi:uncharacterized coiled-coil DUF342 family protein